MLVIGKSGPELDLFQESVAGEYLAAQIRTILPEIDRDGAFFLFALLLAFFALIAMGVLNTRPCGNTVAGVEIADRSPQTAAFVDQRKAGAERIGLGRAVGQDTAQLGEFPRFLGLAQIALFEFFFGDRELLGAQRRREHEAADLDILGLAIAAIDVDDELFAQGDIGRRAAAVAVIGR